MASPPSRIAFLSPRLAEDGAVGGAETLLFNLASLAAQAGFEVEFLTTCARNHFTWANELPPGEFTRGGVKCRRFPVNAGRDGDLFMSLQVRVSGGETLTDADEALWLRHNVNSDAMMDYVRDGGFDRIVVGPYLFGLAVTASQLFPEKTILAPCLHDEPFARIRLIARMFCSVRGFCFNTAPERDLAMRLYFGAAEAARSDGGTAPTAQAPAPTAAVVGFALDDFASSPERGRTLAGDAPSRPSGDAPSRPFDASPSRPVGGVLQTPPPYILFCGRREPLKGTPLLLDYWAAFRRSRPDSSLKFVFTGSGDIERPEGLENDVIDLGFVSEQDKHDLMAGALAFCHASVNESLGIVLLESWLARRPVLVLASGTVLTAQTRAAGGGIWFGNCAEFIAALDLLLARPDIADALGAAGRAWTLAQYSRAPVTSRLASLLKS